MECSLRSTLVGEKPHIFLCVSGAALAGSQRTRFPFPAGAASEARTPPALLPGPSVGWPVSAADTLPYHVCLEAIEEGIM